MYATDPADAQTGAPAPDQSSEQATGPADDGFAVAVIGMAARFPGADGIAAYRDRWAQGARPGPLLEDADAFDHAFFGLSPGEALITDPQQRVLLECAQHALEDAACDPAREEGVVGVYAGCGSTPYAARLRREPHRLPFADDWQIRIATGADFLAARPAYKLGLAGPAVTVQGGAATMLLAVHTAVQGLLAGDCDLALAGAVTVRPAGPDSQESVGGCGIVVLKPLREAREAGDRIHAVVRGTAVANGDDAGGVARQARAVAGVASEAVVPRRAERSRAPGTAVTDTMPGVEAFLDAVLAVSPDAPGGPGLTGVEAAGPHGLQAHVVVARPPGADRPEAGSEEDGGWQLLPLSARDGDTLEELTARLGRHLAGHPGEPVSDVAWTLQTGRTARSARRFVVAPGTAAAAAALNSGKRRLAPSGTAPRTARPVVFTFPGQGGQHVGMARTLYRADPGFRSDVEACSELARPALGFDLRSLVDPRDAAEEERARRALSTIEVGQPAVFMVEYALARALGRWGVRPAAVVGHSLGAYAAACLAGVFSLPDALALVVTRGRLLQSLPSGSMAAVGLPESEVLPLLPDGLGIGAVNGPGQVAVSGPTELVQRFVREFPRPDVEVKLLKIATAGHSALVEPILDEFEAYVAALRPARPVVPVVSDTTGAWADPGDIATAGYWRRHLRHAVRFDDALSTLAREPAGILLEVGPGLTLTSLARRHPALAGPDRLMLQTLPHPADETPELSILLTALGRLWLAGTELDWEALHPGGRRRVRLPGHPFRRSRFTLDSVAPR